ncbi:MAG: DUF2780 domain-containing protein [Planctomycetota bacterium]
MDELIEQLTSQLGIDSSTAQTGVGKTMAMLKDHAGNDLFGQIAGAVPGLEQLVGQAGDDGGDAASAGGGMLGKLAGMASSAMGGGGSGLELGAALSSAGIDAEKLGPFVTMIVTFLKDKVGDEVVEQVLAKFPILKTLLG